MFFFFFWVLDSFTDGEEEVKESHGFPVYLFQFRFSHNLVSLKTRTNYE